MPDWVRKTFDSIGVTQSPPGPALPAVQERYFGHVVLCIDVSGSMADRDGRHTRPATGQSRALGGNKFVLFNAEYYFDVGGPLRLLLFFDRARAERASRIRGSR